MHTTELKGEIGYMFQNQLQNAFHSQGRDIPIATLIMQMLVDEADPAFDEPTKPVGPFYDETEARHLEKTKGYVVRNVKPGKGKTWRRVVPSPEPLRLIEAECIKKLLDARVIVITSGGGGIPVVEKKNGQLIGVEAVIDKDKAGQKLATAVGADILMILTDVEQVYLNYGTANEEKIGSMPLAKAQEYLEAGHFSIGSMMPKVKACTNFIEAGGEQAIITSIDKALDALQGLAGTRIMEM